MGAKPKYIKYKPEILEMHKNGKTDVEITKHINKKYGLNAPKSSIRTIIDREFKTQKTEKTIKTVSEAKPEQLPLLPDPEKEENKKKLSVMLGKIDKNYSKQKEALVLQEKSLSNLASLEAKYTDVTDRYSILNATYHEMTIRKKEESNKESSRYMTIATYILALTFAMVTGYYSRRYSNKISFHYIIIIGYILCGILVGFGFGVVKKKIAAMMQEKNSKPS